MYYANMEISYKKYLVEYLFRAKELFSQIAIDYIWLKFIAFGYYYTLLVNIHKKLSAYMEKMPFFPPNSLLFLFNIL